MVIATFIISTIITAEWQHARGQQSQCGLIHKLCVVGTRPWQPCVRPLPGRMLILCAERRRFRSLALQVGRLYTSRGAKRLRVVLRTYTVSACVVYVCACYLCKTNVCNKLHLEKEKQAARCEGGRAGCAAGNNRRLASLILHILYI